jgi:ubiquinol-cytochrome c reductase cytochrome c1 subunit
LEKTVLKQVKPGTLSPAEYDSLIADLVGFLDYMAEPHRHERQKWGMWVLLFLGIFTLAAWRLNVAYWKDIK